MCRDVKPLQNLDQPAAYRMLAEKISVAEPGNIIIINMMSKMFVTYIFKSTVGCTTDPGQEPAQSCICSIAAKNSVMATLMYQIGGYSHAMCKT